MKHEVFLSRKDANNILLSGKKLQNRIYVSFHSCCKIVNVYEGDWKPLHQSVNSCPREMDFSRIDAYSHLKHFFCNCQQWQKETKIFILSKKNQHRKHSRRIYIKYKWWLLLKCETMDVFYIPLLFAFYF